MGRPKRNIEPQIEVTNEIVAPIQTITNEVEVVVTNEIVKPIKAVSTSYNNVDTVALKNKTTGKIIAGAVNKNYAKKIAESNPNIEIINE